MENTKKEIVFAGFDFVLYIQHFYIATYVYSNG